MQDSVQGAPGERMDRMAVPLTQAPPGRPKGIPGGFLEELKQSLGLYGQDTLVYGLGLLLIVVGLLALAFASGAPQTVVGAYTGSRARGAVLARRTAAIRNKRYAARAKRERAAGD